ncbi:2-succinyl-6-hydroxy-2,4-cyclohexadiene-1-carboxy late synthase [Hyphomicrobiales bacterium 4NK60-0047b]
MSHPPDNLPHHEIIKAKRSTSQWLIMVHGLTQNKNLFNKQIPEFKDDLNLLLIDLPGHGGSSKIKGPYGLSEYAHAIHQVIAHHNITNSIFWGTHIGAGAGLLLACQKPNLFSSLILEGPVFPGRNFPLVSKLLDKIAKVKATKGLTAAKETWWQNGPWFSIMQQKPIECRAADQLNLIEEFKGLPWLPEQKSNIKINPIETQLTKINCPTLIINGEHDVPEFIEIANELYERIPNAKQKRIAEAGGFPLWEYPKTVNEAVKTFIQSLQS